MKIDRKVLKKVAAKENRKKLISFGVVLAVVLCVSGYFLLKNDKPKNERKVIFDAQEKKHEIEEGLVNVPANAKSFVCDAVTSEEVSKVLGVEFNAGKVSIPNTKTAEGEVAACAFESKDKEKSAIGSLIITQRRFNDATKAQEAYSIIMRVANENRKEINDKSHYDTRALQVVSLKDSTLSTASLTRGNGALNEDTYKKLSTLFE